MAQLSEQQSTQDVETETVASWQVEIGIAHKHADELSGVLWLRNDCGENWDVFEGELHNQLSVAIQALDAANGILEEELVRRGYWEPTG